MKTTAFIPSVALLTGSFLVACASPEPTSSSAQRSNAALGTSSTTAAPDRTITSVAGYDHGEGLPVDQVPIVNPKGLFIDGGGNIFYVDTPLNQIRRIDARTHAVTTVVGNGLVGPWGDPSVPWPELDEEGILATQARLSNVGTWSGDSFTMDDRGVLYIADTWNSRVRAVNTNPAGTPPIVVCTVSIEPGRIRTIGGNGQWAWPDEDGVALSTTVAGPTGLELDQDLNLYVSEGWNGVIRRIDAASGIVTTIAGTPGDCKWGNYNGDSGLARNALLCAPLALAFDSTYRYLYITEWIWESGGPMRRIYRPSSGGTVRRIDRQTGIITTYAGNGTREIGGDGGPAKNAGIGQRPSNLAFDAGGNLFITDQENNLIRRVDAVSGIITTVAGGGPPGGQAVPYNAADNGGPAIKGALNNPESIFFHDKRLYIAEQSSGIIRWIDPDPSDGQILGRSTEILNELGSEVGLKQALGAIFDLGGNLLVQSNTHPRIQKLDRAGHISTVVGGSQIPGTSGDGGPAIDARIYGAWFPALDRYGNLYFSDGNRIRRVLAAPGPSGLPEIGPSSTIELVKELPFWSGGLAFNGNILYVAEQFGARVWALDLQNGALALFAGTGDYGYNGDNGLAINATSAGISQIWYDAGRAALYLAEYDNHVVRRIDVETGIITTLAQFPPACEWGPDWCGAHPGWLTMLGSDFLFVHDDASRVIWRLDLTSPASPPVRFAGMVLADAPGGFGGDEVPAPQAMLSGPTGLAVDAAGKLHIMENAMDRVRRVGLVDILPGRFPNTLKLKSGNKIQVAILGTYDFDVRRIDTSTITVAGAPALPSGVKDVDGDGRGDLVVTVDAGKLALPSDAKEAPVRWQMVDGKVFNDADWVTVVP